MGTPAAHKFTKSHVSILSAIGDVDDSRTGDIQLAYEGVWKGHHSGQPIKLTEALFSKWVAAFKARGEKLLVDYEHQTMLAHENGKPNPASGHIIGLSIRHGERGAELWGRVTWTLRAADFIRSGEYTSCSIVFMPVVDRVSGEDLGLQITSVGLTNTPFLEGMAPIQLSFQGVGLMDEPIVEEKEAALAEDMPVEEAPTEEPKEMADPAELSPLAAVMAGMAKTSGKSEAELADAFAANMDAIMQLIGTEVEAVAASATAPRADVVALSAQLSAQADKIAKMETQLRVIAGLKPAVALSSVPNEKRDPKMVDPSALNPVQLGHFNNLLKVGKEPAVALSLVVNNPRMAR